MANTTHCTPRRGTQRRRGPGRTRAAFTLVELLVVVAVIALLIGLLLPSLSRAQEIARRAVCKSNQRMIVVAAIMYADQHPTGAFIPTSGAGEDNLAYLYPHFITVPEQAVCPSTSNFVDPAAILPEENSNNLYGRDVPEHLTRSADDALDEGGTTNIFSFNATGGHSFETWAWRDSWQGSGINGGWTVFPGGWYDRDMGLVDPNTQRGLKETDPAWVDLGQDDEFTPGRYGSLKRLNNVQRPSYVLLTIDSDQDQLRTQDARYGDENAINNWPEPHNNHQDDGTVVSFLDGHVRFVPRGPELIETYLWSGSMGAREIRERIQELHPGLTKETVRIGRNNFTQWYVNR